MALRALGLPALALPALGLPVLATPTQAAAQSTDADGARPRWQGEVTTAAANALLGGLTAGLFHRSRGGSFRSAFWRGAAGGTVVYGGKKLSGQGAGGAGFAGRYLGAVGTSVVANAGEGRGVLDRLILPLGFLWLDIELRETSEEGSEVPGLQVKVDVPSAAIVAWAAFRSDFEFDFLSTLSSGAPVFTYHGDAEWSGRHVGGVILVQPRPPNSGPRPLLRGSAPPARYNTAALVHEQIHVVQRDFAATVWGHPADGRLLERSSLGRAVHRRFAFGSDYLLWGLLHVVIPYDDRPWEREAHFLMNP